MPHLAEIFREYGPEYLQRFGDRMLPSHRRALADIARCRTESCGGHVFQCDHCGFLHYAYHSCRNRSCPQCHGPDTRHWLKARRKELLPLTYFHLVFTLPKELRDIVRSHQVKLLGILMHAVALSLAKLARDPRYVGGKIGVLSVLHTWTRALIYHPHVHCLVPAGGLSADGASWLVPPEGFLVPVRALSRIFRAKFIALARKALPDIHFPESVWHVEWVVYCKPSVQGTEKVLQYLARYVHRIAITDNRILSMDDGQVTFRYKDSREKKWKTISLPAMEFIRRFLQHVLPRSFHKVRYYGLLAPCNRHLLEQARSLVTDEDACPKQTEDSHHNLELSKPSYVRCPSCKVGHLIHVKSVFSPGRAPP